MIRLSADVQRADQDDDLALETRGAPRVHAGNAAAPETADALAADPGRCQTFEYTKVNSFSARPIAQDGLFVFAEIEKKTNLQRKDPRLHLKATAQQEDHAASVGEFHINGNSHTSISSFYHFIFFTGDAGGVAAPVDLHPGSLPREFLGLHHLEGWCIDS